MNLLDNIIKDKKREVQLKKKVVSIQQLENTSLFGERTKSLSKILKNSPFGIIAEHKRRSPSKQEINQSLSVEKIVLGYQNSGAAGISVLTDAKYFGGSLDDLLLAKSCVSIPILRKEFIVEEYQILEAKANGADVILLIAAVLTPNEIKELSEFAQSLGLEVLLEVHNLEELQQSIFPTIDMIGVNNRNLKTFEVNLEYSKSLSEHIPTEFVKISESGISNPKSIMELQQYGYQGFLVGENFMKTSSPENSLKAFLNEINQKR